MDTKPSHYAILAVHSLYSDWYLFVFEHKGNKRCPILWMNLIIVDIAVYAMLSWVGWVSFVRCELLYGILVFWNPNWDGLKCIVLTAFHGQCKALRQSNVPHFVGEG